MSRRDFLTKSFSQHFGTDGVFAVVEIAQDHDRVALFQLCHDQAAQHPGFGHAAGRGAQRAQGAADGVISGEIRFGRVICVVGAVELAQLGFQVAVEHGDDLVAHRDAGLHQGARQAVQFEMARLAFLTLKLAMVKSVMQDPRIW